MTYLLEINLNEREREKKTVFKLSKKAILILGNEYIWVRKHVNKTWDSYGKKTCK